MCLGLELNAKGVILQAFEEYRLRSCVDFKPYEGESSYISFTKQSGWVTLYCKVTQFYRRHRYTLSASGKNKGVILIKCCLNPCIFRCWSYVGDDGVGQDLSIGAGCDTKAVVVHELLHALGFYHEQSRSDRDDYVKIWWDQIEEGEAELFWITSGEWSSSVLATVYFCHILQY